MRKRSGRVNEIKAYKNCKENISKIFWVQMFKSKEKCIDLLLKINHVMLTDYGKEVELNSYFISSLSRRVTCNG